LDAMEAYYVKVKTEHRVLQDRIRELEVLTGTLESQLRVLEEEHALCADFRCGCGFCWTRAGPLGTLPSLHASAERCCATWTLRMASTAPSPSLWLAGWLLLTCVLARLGCRSESEAAVRQRNELQARKDVLEQQLREQQVGWRAKLNELM